MENYLEFISGHTALESAGFETTDDALHFHGINLLEVIETYGTPLRFTYLPSISEKIRNMQALFQLAMTAEKYKGRYTYCFCTKSSHFSYVLNEALSNPIGIEISSAFDIPLLSALLASGKMDEDTLIICNGFKTAAYQQGIVALIREGNRNIVPILDNKDEFHYYTEHLNQPLNLGVRIASDDRPASQLYTSRLGIRGEEILDFYRSKIEGRPNFKLTTLHFFIDSGISDSRFYWEELDKHVALYCKLSQINPWLSTLDIGGGMPFMDSFDFKFDYLDFVTRIIQRIKAVCQAYGVTEPNLITEFGKYTVAEASGIVYKVLGRKQQNHNEKWLMLDGSFITSLPDTWAIGQQYLLLPVNNLEGEQEQVYLGGMTCDGDDYYHSGHDKIFMPKTLKTQYIGFFHTGAYQEVLSGFGGIHHCLLPGPKHILIDRNKDETLSYRVFAEEQNSKQALKILGYL